MAELIPEQEPVSTVLKECLSIDLEVDAKAARIYALAAWRPEPANSSQPATTPLMPKGQQVGPRGLRDPVHPGS